MKNCVFKSSKSEARALKQLDKNYKNILSIGISTGGVAEIKMARECPNAEVVATTIDEAGLEFTRSAIANYPEKDRLTLKIEDVSQPMPYGDATFDFVYARLVLHYLSRQQLNFALTEIYRVLKPGGKFFVVARNNKEWELTKPEFIISYDKDTNLTTYYEQWDYKIIRTRQFLSQEQLEDALKSHGFKIVSSESYEEYLYTDYERTIKSKKPNSLTEIVAIK